MEYTEFKEVIVDYLSGNLTEEKHIEFEQFLSENSQHQEEFEASKVFWAGAEEEIPTPTSAMDVKFYTMLNAQEKRTQKESVFKSIETLLFGNFPKQLAYTLAILVAGFFIGNGLNIGNSSAKDSVEIAKKETEKVRSELVLTLLDQPSANKRLQAVNEVGKLNTVTETIIKALFSTLNNDDNVNVRLSAIEALKNYTDIPLVREGLVSSIIHQSSPLVQIELADLMVVLQEKKAVKPLKELIKEKDVNTNAKQKMEESIQSII
ncbi:HEAT repeat domain-containing protein [Flavobacteriaceae bacterium S356]|uniref:HEAT repeat domain-containing protein n=1 Tax=Asprobacillus argus TaxID=3076534 RepID=A0ABU3LIH2_9FLAO|nr:HEAT repeat domain-containing protein [Flavobacteriaceae bacterium S356]